MADSSRDDLQLLEIALARAAAQCRATSARVEKTVDHMRQYPPRLTETERQAVRDQVHGEVERDPGFPVRLRQLLGGGA